MSGLQSDCGIGSHFTQDGDMWTPTFAAVLGNNMEYLERTSI